MVREPLEPGCLYHIYNHAVGKDNLFLSDDNYYFFLRRYEHFINPVASTYSYCLMPNHLHVLVEINQNIAVPENSSYSTSQFVSKQFANLFSSYTQAFNKQQSRMGNLFISNFKRKRIDSDQYLTTIIQYIHHNPIHHNFAKDISHWRFSSYNSLCSPQESFLSKEKVIGWFGSVDAFKTAHTKESQLPESLKLSGS